jgi:hypothetical protein
LLLVRAAWVQPLREIELNCVEQESGERQVWALGAKHVKALSRSLGNLGALHDSSKRPGSLSQVLELCLDGLCQSASGESLEVRVCPYPPAPAKPGAAGAAQAPSTPRPGPPGSARGARVARAPSKGFALRRVERVERLELVVDEEALLERCSTGPRASAQALADLLAAAGCEPRAWREARLALCWSDERRVAVVQWEGAAEALSIDVGPTAARGLTEQERELDSLVDAVSILRARAPPGAAEPEAAS